MEALDVDVWLLTEAHLDVVLAGHVVHCSEQRHIKPKQRWSAISSKWPLVPLPSPHVGMALARVVSPEEPLLVACSVMPWKGALASWPGDRKGKHGVRFQESLEAHAEAITGARDGSEAVVWGGDFNQALEGRERAGSLSGRALLLRAFEDIGITALTGNLSHRIGGIMSIDHLAVPRGWVATEARMVMPMAEGGKPLSDHAAYVVEAAPV